MSSEAAAEQSCPSGPLSPPGSTTWRRQRLLRVGSNSVAQTPESTTDCSSKPLRSRKSTYSLASTHSLPVDESTALRGRNNASYGSLSHFKIAKGKSNFRSRHGLPDLPFLNTRQFASNPATPRASSPLFFREASRLNTWKQRPISAYDAPTVDADQDVEPDAKVNGIRVWYSSFSSIDWLHDAIKDSVRQSRLRKRKSLRGRIRLLIDRSIGWIVVSIVGFLTAVVAFLVVRSEQWMFHAKEGYCTTGWWKSMPFCCPRPYPLSGLLQGVVEKPCEEWKTWGEVFGPNHGYLFEYGVVEYVAFASIAVGSFLLACQCYSPLVCVVIPGIGL